MKLEKILAKPYKDRLKESDVLSWASPMLATLFQSPFSKKGWIFERKFDGERCLAFKDKDSVSIYSRNKKKINVAYPEIVESLKKIKTGRIVLDGEIVTFEGNVTSFSKLQERIQLRDPKRIKKSRIKVYYYVFDILYADGFDLRDLPLKERKKILKKTISFGKSDTIRFSTYRKESGREFFKKACRDGWEGLIAKKDTSRYETKRSKMWLKFKCSNRQEFVIVGYTEPKGKRSGFGALLLGYYENEKLQYAGDVGTGFDEKMLQKIMRLLSQIEKEKPAVDVTKEEIPRKKIHWIKPQYVCEVAFTEWTSSGKLRHPRFEGLRRDKDPKKVVREYK